MCPYVFVCVWCWNLDAVCALCLSVCLCLSVPVVIVGVRISFCVHHSNNTNNCNISEMQRRSSRVVEQTKRLRANSDHEDEVGGRKGNWGWIQCAFHLHQPRSPPKVCSLHHRCKERNSEVLAKPTQPTQPTRAVTTTLKRSSKWSTSWTGRKQRRRSSE